MLTCPCNVYTITPHFYIVKLGFTGVYIFFLILFSDIDCGYSLEPPLCFEQKYENSKKIQPKIVIFTAVKNRYILHRACFRNRVHDIWTGHDQFLKAYYIWK